MKSFLQRLTPARWALNALENFHRGRLVVGHPAPNAHAHLNERESPELQAFGWLFLCPHLDGFA